MSIPEAEPKTERNQNGLHPSEQQSRPKPPKYVPTLPFFLRAASTAFTGVAIVSGWCVALFAQSLAKLITFPFSTREQRADICAHIFRRVSYFTAVALNPLWRITCLRPMPNIRSHKRVIFMMNHLSNADPYIVTGYILPRESKWICKSELFRIPIGGWGLANCGDLKVEFIRENGRSRVKKGTVGKMMEQAKKYILSGRFVSVFPEGTRNPFPEGPMGEFKLGFFNLAVEINATIVPVALSGTERMWPVNEYLLDYSRGYISFGDPITPRDGETPEQLRDRVASVIDGLRNTHPDRKALLSKQKQ